MEVGSPRDAGRAALAPFKQLSLPQVLALWVAAAAPMVLLAWLVAPGIVYRLAVPAVISYWLILLPGMLWQTALGLWVIRRQEGRLGWATVRQAAWLGSPHDPRTGAPQPARLWRALLHWPLVGLILVIGVLTPIWALLASRAGFEYGKASLLHWPAYANFTELASPEFAGQWPLLIAVLLAWVVSAVLAEEFLFRGVLLPRMAGAFHRGDWAGNALLFALYTGYQYWLIPFRLLEGLLVARQARRHLSLWPAVAVRGVEAVGLLLLTGMGVGAKPLSATAPTLTFPTIARQPAPLVLVRGPLAAVPAYNPGSTAPLQVDLRGADLSGLDLRGAAGDLAYADFSTRTIWPPAGLLPAGFDPERILAVGLDPGLGVRSLHVKGITGRGVGVAIIDQLLLTEHMEYADRLRWYEEGPGGGGAAASLHGPALASLALGRTVGMAPEAELYYISATGGVASLVLYGHEYAQAIRRILQINAGLPPEQEIRVISISSGFLPSVAGFHDFIAAVAKAEAAGIMVVYVGKASGLPPNVGLNGLGRPLVADPNRFDSFEPGIQWAAAFYTGDGTERRVLVPMDSRTVAGPGGRSDYTFSRVGSASWTPPYVAGLYALAAQADPAITPEYFWAAALRTGRTVQVERDGLTRELSVILDPVALIEELQGTGTKERATRTSD